MARVMDASEQPATTAFFAWTRQRGDDGTAWQTMPRHRRPELDPRIPELADAVRGISAPFVSSGELRVRAAVTLRFRDGTGAAVVPASGHYEQEMRNEPLIQRCLPASYGHGRKTRYNLEVRQALQLNAAGGAFVVENFDPASTGILEQVRQQLAPADPNPLSAELYALNIYNQKGHFRPHKDTPRGGDMLGTLVVCLPSIFSAGQFVVVHRGAPRVFDWGAEIEKTPDANTLRWAAFFGDVDHAVERVWTGSRVTLSYILRRGEGAPASPESPPQSERLSSLLAAAAAERTFLPEGGVLAFPCFHMYSEDQRFQRTIEPLTPSTVLALKGRDLLVARAALGLGLAVELHPYMVETCADMRRELSHFPTPKQKTRLRHRMDNDDLEKVLPIAEDLGFREVEGVHWVIPQPCFNGAPYLYGHDHDGMKIPTNPEVPALEYLHGCEHSTTGYFGNEGGDTEFYVYAALHVRFRAASARRTPAAQVEQAEQPEKPATKKTATPVSPRSPVKNPQKPAKASETDQQGPGPHWTREQLRQECLRRGVQPRSLWTKDYMLGILAETPEKGHGKKPPKTK